MAGSSAAVRGGGNRYERQQTMVADAAISAPPFCFSQ